MHPLSTSMPIRATALAASLLMAACGGGEADIDAGLDPASNPEGISKATGAGPGRVSRVGPEVVVQLEPGFAIAPIATALGLTVLDQFGRRPIYRLRLRGGGNLDAMLDALRNTPGVKFAEPNVLSETPEGRRSSQWAIGGDAGTFGTQWAPQTLRLGPAHARSRGEGVRVAVLDTGIDADHPALAGVLARRADGSLLGRDFVDDDANPAEEGSRIDLGWGHGTHVAGLVALAAPAARIMPVRVLDRAGRGNAWVLAEALAWAVDPDGNPRTDDGAHLVNLSLGTTRPTALLKTVAELVSCEFGDDDDDYEDPGFDDDRLRCELGHRAAVLAAAGNSGSADERIYPAAEEVKGTRAVAAGNAQQQLAAFSNSGGWIKLAAPGEAIISTVPGGGWGTWSGTSMAAPLATGTAALVLATLPRDGDPTRPPQRQWLPEDLLKRLEDRSKPLCNASVKQIDAMAAVSDTQAPDPACP